MTLDLRSNTIKLYIWWRLHNGWKRNENQILAVKKNIIKWGVMYKLKGDAGQILIILKKSKWAICCMKNCP